MTASQTGTASNGPDLATDGDSNVDVTAGTCANPSDASGSALPISKWKIVFERNFYIYRVVVFRGEQTTGMDRNSTK